MNSNRISAAVLVLLGASFSAGICEAARYNVGGMMRRVQQVQKQQTANAKKAQEAYEKAYKEEMARRKAHAEFIRDARAKHMRANLPKSTPSTTKASPKSANDSDSDEKKDK